jgi:hypothetical protein
MRYRKNVEKSNVREGEEREREIEPINKTHTHKLPQISHQKI